MTDRALDDLIAAVEAEVLTEELALQNGHALPMCASTWAAYLGDLNAAKALHEALLPGWQWGRTPVGVMWVSAPGSPTAYGDDANHARAWLLAILRAYRGMQG